ncbi:hypothetical protein CONLIGDRAFT_695133 [Coniochaeta ligniaria NRRL 30616]|uniref:Rhodopsin domain-containing protein n=1 Tax=Coniochaeta ligniaria NRRL 30616 TaxID=1408157 RepID=A0A1J7JSC9_9PEZI|nr:hypothetical protein CONLIGDRAFT_695133 [Coniochaeta ligniaria NRRL 30616]
MDFDADQGPKILISTWTLVGLSFTFLVARLYCKARARRGLWWDDHVLIISWMCLLASIITVTWSVPRGLGRHVYAAPVENISTLALIGNVTGSLSILAAVWSKTSFALTLLRILQGRMRALVWFIIISSNVAMSLNALFVWIRCTPVSKTWNVFEEGSCWEPHVYPNFGMFAAGYSAAMDFVLALLPWKIIWNLQMKGKEKFGVAVAMSMGIFAGATAVVKTTEIPSLASGDFTCRSLALCRALIIWGAAESAVTIMAASIPILRTLFHDLRASSRKYYASHIVDDSGSSRFARSRNGEVTMSAALGDFQGRPRYLNDGRPGGELKLATVIVRQPDLVYGASGHPKRGRKGFEYA